MTPNENPNNASVDGQTPGYPSQTPTPPNAPYGPSPEPKLAERLNVQALVDFIKRPPVLVALLVVAAFCLGRCNGGDKNEVAQTSSAATEKAPDSDAVAGGKIVFQSREEFMRKFCQICRRALTRIRLNVNGSTTNDDESNAEVLEYFLDIDSTPPPSVWPEIQKYGLPEWKIALEEFQTFDLSQFSDVEQAQFALYVDCLCRLVESDRLTIHAYAIQANEVQEMFLSSIVDFAPESEKGRLKSFLKR